MWNNFKDRSRGFWMFSWPEWGLGWYPWRLMKLQWWSKSQAMVKGEISVCQPLNNVPLKKNEDRESTWILLLNSQLELNETKYCTKILKVIRRVNLFVTLLCCKVEYGEQLTLNFRGELHQLTAPSQVLVTREHLRENMAKGCYEVHAVNMEINSNVLNRILHALIR